jgi:metal-responsive CopG/Arc/MetJ family transcriptional regulator
MQRTSKNLWISFPKAMLKEVARISARSHRSRSELVREAVRVYLRVSGSPAAKPTARELSEMRRGRAEIARGEIVTLEEIEHAMAGRPRV